MLQIFWTHQKRRGFGVLLKKHFLKTGIDVMTCVLTITFSAAAVFLSSLLLSSLTLEILLGVKVLVKVQSG